MSPHFESVHLPHFDGDDVPPRVAKLFAFYGDLARFASLTESGRTRRVPIRCRRRPAHRQCPGLLIVRRRDLPAAVEWECPACGAQGQISGWEDTDADLRSIALDPDANRPVPMSVAEHAALRDLARVETSLIPLAYGAEVDDAAQPLLFVSDASGGRHGTVLLRHAWATSSRRRGDLLVGLAEALATVTAAAEVGSGLFELDAELAAGLISALNALESGGEAQFVAVRPRPQPKSTKSKGTKSRAKERRTFQIKVTLRDVKPPVWRRLIVPSDIGLPALHEVLQAAMGWHNGHLHQFRVRDRAFAPPGDFDPFAQEDSRGVALSDIAPGKGSRVVYEYDFGDGWTHDIVVEDVLDERCASVRCLTGRRRCPPEDCGGPWGYADLRAALADPAHERHDELRGWIDDDFDPEEFDVVDTDAVVSSIRV